MRIGPWPTVICLEGSDGGLSEGTAAVLASEGLAEFALGYFGAGDLPAELRRIPLEYSAGAIDWLARRPSVDVGRIAVLGASKGAEAALLLAVTYPDRVGAVVAYWPSAVVWQAVTIGDPRAAVRPATSSTSSRLLSGDPRRFPAATTRLRVDGATLSPVDRWRVRWDSRKSR